MINTKRKKSKSGNRETGRAMQCEEVRVQFGHRLEGGVEASHEGVRGGTHFRQLKQKGKSPETTLAAACLRVTEEATVFSTRMTESGQSKRMRDGREGGRRSKGSASNSRISAFTLSEGGLGGEH